MGRPPKPASERQRHQIAIRLTDAEHKKLVQLATKAGKARGRGFSVSEYIRFKLGLR